MPFVSRRKHNSLLESERNKARDKERQYYEENNALELENNDLKEKVKQLEKYKEDFETLKTEYDKLKEKTEVTLNREVEKRMKDLGIDTKKYEQLIADREELIELYIDQLYYLARNFAIENKKDRENRGLFIILIDERNLVDDNFSIFYEGQEEYLDQERYIGIENAPHIFSPQIAEIFEYMGEKLDRLNENGEIIGYDERDGSFLINLNGLASRSCIMVEGVRTHKVYDKVESLLEGNAKHNAAIYASSLNEVMATIVISEETSKVTLFRYGAFIKSYDPYTEVEYTREEMEEYEKKGRNIVPIKQPIAITETAMEIPQKQLEPSVKTIVPEVIAEEPARN